MHIGIFHSNAVIQETILEFLKRMGHTGFEFRNDAAGDFVKGCGRSPDCCILELQSNRSSDFEIARSCRHAHPNIPIVLIADWRIVVPAQEALAIGVHSFLREPFRFDELEFVVCRIQEIVTARHCPNTQQDLMEQLAQAQKREAVGQLASGVAHDFNNLLGAILGYSDLILENMSEDSPMRHEVDMICRTAQKAAHLTRQLLNFSRKQTAEKRIIDINETIHEIEEILRRVIHENIELNVAEQPDVGRIHADPVRIEQILINLVINARDAMADGGRVTLSTESVYLDDDFTKTRAGVRSGPYVLISVADTGCGMDEATKRKVFEPFFTTKNPGMGTGLGLSTVYNIVHELGGTIDVETELGVGSEFRVYLPRVNSRVAERSVVSCSITQFSGSETILVAEDDEVLLRTVCRILRNSGYHVIEALNGNDALARNSAHHGPIHLLLTDVIMPEMGGRCLARALHKTRDGLKVIFTSGYAAGDFAPHGATEIEAQFLDKPLSAYRLLEAVRSMLDCRTPSYLPKPLP